MQGYEADLPYGRGIVTIGEKSNDSDEQSVKPYNLTS